MIADLHAHYPMHLQPQARGGLFKLIRTRRGHRRLTQIIRALLLRILSMFGNYRSFDSGPRMTLPLMRAGGYGVALSVLYSPFDEMDLTVRYPALPGDGYFPALMGQLREVEHEIEHEHADEAAIAHNPAELDAAVAAGKVALVHCVEGGFHLGSTPERIARNVTELAHHGVGYITLAHLFYRQIATNTNAIPFLPDWLYNLVFPQPEAGLTELGRAAVAAMVRERVPIDLSHASERTLTDVFGLLDELDPDRDVPVLITHVAYRFGKQEYNLSDATIQRVAARGGVMGLIFAEHQAAEGLRRTHSLQDSLEVLFAHINRIHEAAGSHRHTALGTDFDGFIKPTLAGLEDASNLAAVERALIDRYGPEDGGLIASGNALRILREYWRGGP